MTEPQPGRHAASATLGAARARMSAPPGQPARFPRHRRPLGPELRQQIGTQFEAGDYCTTCVPPGTYVGSHTPVPIEQVAIGDELLMPDGTCGETVNATTHHYNGGMRTIYARSTLPLRVTDDHLLLVYPALHHRRGAEGWHNRQKIAPEGERPVWRRADEVRPGDFVVCPIPRIEGPEPPERWSSPDACWLLGILAGDGSTSGRDGKLYYTVLGMGLKKPVAEAVRVLEGMGYRVSVGQRQNPRAPLAIVRVSSRELAEDVAALIGRGSRNKHLPDFVWSSKERLSAALEGLMATDGCRKVHKGFESRDFFTTSLTLAWQVWFAALALGEKPNIMAVNRTSGYPNASPAWRVQWTFGAKRLFTVRLDDTYVLPVKKVEAEDYDGPVHDLTASPSPTFIANGILTHNCGGIHAGLGMLACPRIAAAELDADGKLRYVVFWQPGEYDTSEVYFASDAEPDGDPA